MRLCPTEGWLRSKQKKEIVIIITISRLEVTPTGFKPVTF